MNLENDWTYLAYLVCITALGLLGNTFGVLGSFRKSMQTIGPMYVFRCLFIFDSILMLIHSETLFNKIFLFDIKMMSRWACRLWFYVSFQATSVGSFMHIYITLERLLSMKYPVGNKRLNKGHSE